MFETISISNCFGLIIIIIIIIYFPLYLQKKFLKKNKMK